MAGRGAAEELPAGQAEAIGGGRAVPEGHGRGEAVVEPIRLVPRRVDELLPGDHVFEAGGDAGVARPVDVVDGRAEACGERAFVAHRTAGDGGCVGIQPRIGHAGDIEDPAAKEIAELLAGPLLDEVGDQAEVVVAIGVAGAGGEMQALRAADDAVGILGVEDAFDRRAIEHGDGPVVAQAGLVVGEVEDARRAFRQRGQAATQILVEDARVGKLVEHQAAGELLRDGADEAHGQRCEGDAAFGVGPSPAVAREHLAVADHGDRAAGADIAPRERGERLVESGMGHD